MFQAPAVIDPDALARARALVQPPRRTERVWPVLCAALALAVSSLAFATAMLAAPPLVTEHVAVSSPR